MGFRHGWSSLGFKVKHPYFSCIGGEKVTVNEASEKYHIPVEVLKEYESWGLCGEVKKVMGYGSIMTRICNG